MKSAPKMLTFERVFAERWKICDIVEKLACPQSGYRVGVSYFALYHRCEK